MRFIRNTGFIHNYVHAQNTYHLNFDCVLFSIREACIFNILNFNDDNLVNILYIVTSNLAVSR